MKAMGGNSGFLANALREVINQPSIRNMLQAVAKQGISESAPEITPSILSSFTGLNQNRGASNNGFLSKILRNSTEANGGGSLFGPMGGTMNRIPGFSGSLVDIFKREPALRQMLVASQQPHLFPESNLMAPNLGGGINDLLQRRMGPPQIHQLFNPELMEYNYYQNLPFPQ